MRGNWYDDDRGGGNRFGGRSGGVNLFPFHLSSLPVVKICLAGLVATFLVGFFLQANRSLAELLAFRVAGVTGFDWLLRPWTWVGYAFLTSGFLSLLFQGFWLYIVGGSLERSWGSRNFAVLLAVFTAIAALAWVPAYYFKLVSPAFLLAGPTLTLSALLVAWAALDPDMQIYFWGVIPVRLKWLAVIDVALVYFSYGSTLGPLSAVFALAAPATAYLYVRKMPRLMIGYRTPRRTERPRLDRPLLRESYREDPERNSGFNPFRKRQERIEIERLRKLLGDDDEDRPVRH